MKKLSKLHITSSIFISANFIALISLNKTANTAPTGVYSKVSTLQLLSEVVRNPMGAFIQKISNGKLKGHFIHSGVSTTTYNNFSVRPRSIIQEKTHDNKFKYLSTEGANRIVVAESSAFKILTYSKNSLIKEINMVREGENIVITSEKGARTPQHVLKNTILNFGNLDDNTPSTSSQASAPSSKPTITITRHSISNRQSSNFDTEKTSVYEASSLKLISQVTKIKSHDKIESTTQHEDGTTSKIVEHIDGRKNSFVYNHMGETLFSNVTEPDRSNVVTTRLNENTYSKLRYNSNKKLVEEKIITPTSSETKIFNEQGEITSTSRINVLANGETVETTTHENGYIVTNEKRQDGSLLSIITRTPSGELLKQDFNQSNLPLNNPYRIN